MSHLEYICSQPIEPDWRQALKRLDGAYAPSTMKSYRVNVEIFVSWCNARKYQAFPASVETVAEFLADQARTCSISTIKGRFYAIRKVHRLLELPDCTIAEEINLVLRRIRRSKFYRPKQAKALNDGHKIKFISAQPPTPWGIRDKAIIALGYDILARRSELVSIKTTDIEFRSDKTVGVIIRRSKSDPFGSGRIAYTSRETANLLTDWLDWRGENKEYLFCPIYQGKALNRSLNATSIKRVIKKAARLAGYDESDVSQFSGHSMRVGAAQDLLCAGYDTAAIMRAGGWKSIHVLARYLEAAEHNVWV